MLGLARSHPLPIGVDLGHDSVKVLQLDARGGELSLVAAARQQVPTASTADEQTQAAIDTLRRMLARHPFRGRKVVTTLPRHLLHVRGLRVTGTSDESLAASLQTEIREAFPFDTAEGNARVHCITTGEIRSGGDVRRDVLCFAARHVDVDAFLDRMHAGGVVVSRLEPEATALFRCHRASAGASTGGDVSNRPAVIIDIGDRRTQVLIGRGPALSFYKAIEIGASHLHSAVSRKLGISPDDAKALRRRLTDAGDTDHSRAIAVRKAVYDATRGIAEELAREVAMCLRYQAVTFRGPRPSGVTLSGGEARDPQIHAMFKSALDLTVTPARPFDAVVHEGMRTKDGLGPQSEWALAVGLALRFADTAERPAAAMAGEAAHV